MSSPPQVFAASCVYPVRGGESAGKRWRSTLAASRAVLTRPPPVRRGEFRPAGSGVQVVTKREGLDGNPFPDDCVVGEGEMGYEGLTASGA